MSICFSRKYSSFYQDPHPEYNENSIELIHMLPKVKKWKNVYSMTIVLD